MISLHALATGALFLQLGGRDGSCIREGLPISQCDPVDEAGAAFAHNAEIEIGVFNPPYLRIEAADTFETRAAHDPRMQTGIGGSRGKKARLVLQLPARANAERFDPAEYQTRPGLASNTVLTAA